LSAAARAFIQIASLSAMKGLWRAGASILRFDPPI